MKKYRVIYQAKSTYDGVVFNYSWEVWKKNIPTLEEAEKIRQQCVRIFGTAARVV